MYCWRFRFKSHQRDYPLSLGLLYIEHFLVLQAMCSILLIFIALEQYKGFEPSPPAWKAGMLAIEHQYSIWHALRDLNP